MLARPRPVRLGRPPDWALPFEDILAARVSGSAGGDRLAFPTLLHGIAYGLLLDATRECDALARYGTLRLVGGTRSALWRERERLVTWILGGPAALPLPLCCDLWNLERSAVQREMLARLAGKVPAVKTYQRRRD